jgi:hypothetical protein
MSSVPSRNEPDVRPVEVDIIILEWNRSDATMSIQALDQTGVRRKVRVVDQGSALEHR